jgi:hypothetical protein
VKNGIDLKQYISLVKQGSPAVQVPLTTGEMTSVLPSQTLFLPLDKAAIDKAGFVPPLLRPLVGDTLQWSIGKRDLYKPDLIMLDIIATNNWQRPIYFSSTLASDNYLNLKDHMQVEGYAYRLMPVRVDGASDGYVNSEIAMNNLMKRSFWREMNNPNTYYDETYKGSPVLTARIAFFRLADQLIREKRPADAKKVLDYSLSVIPDNTIPFDQISANFVRFYFDVGATKQALQIADTMVTRIDQNLNYSKTSGRSFGDVNSDLYSLNTIVEACKEAKQDVLAKKYEALLEKHYSAFGG